MIGGLAARAPNRLFFATNQNRATLDRIREMTFELANRQLGALIALETRSGQIKAMVGGYDFERSKFNRATQARRQPGSSFKAFALGAAVEEGARIAVLEAMKMQLSLTAPLAGTVRALSVAQGEQIEEGAVICTLEAETA